GEIERSLTADPRTCLGREGLGTEARRMDELRRLAEGKFEVVAETSHVRVLLEPDLGEVEGEAVGLVVEDAQIVLLGAGVPGIIDVPALKIETEAERCPQLVNGHVPDRLWGRRGRGGRGRAYLLLRSRLFVLLLLGVAAEGAKTENNKTNQNNYHTSHSTISSFNR